MEDFLLLRASREWMIEPSMYVWPCAKGWECQDEKIIVSALQDHQAYCGKYKQKCAGAGLYQLWGIYAHPFPIPIQWCSIKISDGGGIYTTIVSNCYNIRAYCFKHLSTHHCAYLNIPLYQREKYHSKCHGVFFYAISHSCGILVPWPGIEPMPLQWKQGLSTTGPPGNSFDGVLRREKFFLEKLENFGRFCPLDCISLQPSYWPKQEMRASGHWLTDSLGPCRHWSPFCISLSQACALGECWKLYCTHQE